jgi:hypothetical protein
LSLAETNDRKVAVSLSFYTSGIAAKPLRIRSPRQQNIGATAHLLGDSLAVSRHAICKST